MSTQQSSLYFEDFEVGQRFTSYSQAITEADLVLFRLLVDHHARSSSTSITPRRRALADALFELDARRLVDGLGGGSLPHFLSRPICEQRGALFAQCERDTRSRRMSMYRRRMIAASRTVSLPSATLPRTGTAPPYTRSKKSS